MKTGGKSDVDVTNFRHVLVEFDLDEKGNPIPKELQFGALIDSGLPISCIIDSGNKSLHGWVKIEAPGRQEYDRRRDLVWDHFKTHHLDPQNKNPSRYSRAPGVERKICDKDGNTTGLAKQTLLALNVGCAPGKRGNRRKMNVPKLTCASSS
jgi:RecA-family ATPase